MTPIERRVLGYRLRDLVEAGEKYELDLADAEDSDSLRWKNKCRERGDALFHDALAAMREAAAELGR